MKPSILLPAAMLCAASLSASGAPEAAPPAAGGARPLKVLAIGNSFSQSLCRFLPAAAAAAGEELEFCNLFIGGCPLSRHAENIRRAEAEPDFAPYAVTWFRAGRPDSPEKSRANVPQMLATQAWDVVTLQQASHESWNPKTFHPWGDEVLAAVRALAPGAKVVWHETWAYNPADGRIGGESPSWGFDQKGMFARIETNAFAFAGENGLGIIPCGLAVEKRRAALRGEGRVFDPAVLESLRPGETPDLKGEPAGSFRWKDGALARDTIHLNRSGEYLQAVTWLGFLFGRDVRGLDFAPPEAGSAEDCAAMRAAAADALAETAARFPAHGAPGK